MPYGPGQEPIPDYVPADKADEWAARWNSAWEQCLAVGGTGQECEECAFANANAILSEEDEVMSNARLITYFAAVNPGDWMRILPLGTFERFGRKVLVTYEKISEMAANFGRVPNSAIPVSLEHEHEHGKVADVVAVQARSDGLYARLGNYVGDGEQKLISGAFQYFSPEIRWGPTDYDGQQVSNVLVGLALTNMPYFGEQTALYTLEQDEESGHDEDEQYGLENIEGFAVWTRAFINRLPDSAFLWIEDDPDGTKDDEGKTTPRTLRRFPIRNAQGEIDLPHLRNALSRIPQATYRGGSRAGQKLSRSLVERLLNEAREILARATEESSIGGNDMEQTNDENVSLNAVERILKSVGLYRADPPQPEPEQPDESGAPTPAPEQVDVEAFRALAEEHKTLREEHNALVAANEHRARVESYSTLGAFDEGLPELLAAHPDQEATGAIAKRLSIGLEKLRAAEAQEEFVQRLLGTEGVDSHGEEGDPVEQYTAAIDKTRKENPGLSYTEAVKLAEKNHPELAAAYRDATPVHRHSGGE